MVWCNLFLFTSIRGPARSCMLVLQGRGGGHWRMFTLWPFGLLWVMGMALAWDKVNHQEDTTQQTFRNDTTRLQRHDCADLEVKFPHNPPSRCFHALTTVNDDHRKYFSRRSGDRLAGLELAERGDGLGAGWPCSPIDAAVHDLRLESTSYAPSQPLPRSRTRPPQRMAHGRHGNLNNDISS